MDQIDKKNLQKLYIPPEDSHKGQNGKVMIIAGSELFHAAALWALEVASHLVDMVYFCSTSENNAIVSRAKKEFRNGIVVPRNKIDYYIEEADSILIGPGLPRKSGLEQGDDDSRELTRKYLSRYRNKKWVIDGGSLQTMDLDWIPPHSILTPHIREFEKLFGAEKTVFSEEKRQSLSELVQNQAQQYHCTIVLKGETDIVCSSDRSSEDTQAQCVLVPGGNAGMTKGGTGDVLAGIAVGLYAKNDAFLAAQAASFFNKRAAENLFKEKGYWYSTSDLVNEIPRVMRKTILI